MQRKNTNQLEFTLNNTGETLSYAMTLLPLALYIYIYGISRQLLLALAVLASIAIFLSWYRPQKELKGNLETILVIGSFHLIFAAMVLLLLPAGSPLVFLGVMFSALNYYSFGKMGVLVSAFFNIFVVIVHFLLLGDELMMEDLATLVAIVAQMFLLTYFLHDIIDVAQDQLNTANNANKTIKLEHQRLVSLVNNIGDAVVATDQEGRIQTYNGAALELLDTNQSLTGKLLKETWQLQDENGQPVDLITEVTSAGRNIRRSDLYIFYGEGDKARLYVNVTPIKVGVGDTEQHGFTLIMRDITKEKSLDEERDEFVSVVSHELRTPITITEGKVSNAQLLLNQTKLNKKKVSAALSETHDQVVFLANMINDLATLARAERDDIKLDVEPIDPHQLIEDLTNSYEIETRQLGLDIKVEPPKSHLSNIYTNRLYLQEILQNFVSNSLKYTREGGITLSAEQVGESVTFRVRDTGIGISKSDQKRLFEKFFRSEDYRTRESSGTGLGLYVTRKLADKLQAKIQVESQLNIGSTFMITVPSLPEASSERHAREPSGA